MKLTWGSIASILFVALVAGWWWSVKKAEREIRREETATLMTQLLSENPDSLEALHKLVMETRAEIGELHEMLRQRGTSLNLFQQGVELIDEESRYKAMLTAVEVTLPLTIDKRLDDLEKRGLLAWALDYAVAHDPSLETRADDLRRQVLDGLPPAPDVVNDQWSLIPKGGFEMGSLETELDRDDDEQLHLVKLSSFRMLKHEVTNQELRLLVTDHQGSEGSEDLPAVNVSWYAAYVYAAWLGGRLPTEAEWEYAARAGCAYAYCDHDGNVTTLDLVGWTRDHPAFEESSPTPQPVAQLEPNAWGLHDMYGNVWEWTADWYGPYDAASRLDPLGPPSGFYRVIRGGSYWNLALNARAANRDRRLPVFRVDLLGFRVVLPSPRALR